MNINLTFNDEQTKKIQKKFEEYADELLTDEYLKETFNTVIGGLVKQLIYEYTQTKDFRDIIKQKVTPLIINSFGAEMMLKELDK